MHWKGGLNLVVWLKGGVFTLISSLYKCYIFHAASKYNDNKSYKRASQEDKIIRSLGWTICNINCGLCKKNDWKGQSTSDRHSPPPNIMYVLGCWWQYGFPFLHIIQHYLHPTCWCYAGEEDIMIKFKFVLHHTHLFPSSWLSFRRMHLWLLWDCFNENGVGLVVKRIKQSASKK